MKRSDIKSLVESKSDVGSIVTKIREDANQYFPSDGGLLTSVEIALNKMAAQWDQIRDMGIDKALAIVNGDRKPSEIAQDISGMLVKAGMKPDEMAAAMKYLDFLYQAPNLGGAADPGASVSAANAIDNGRA